MKYTKLPRTRVEALATGSVRYWTGRKCSNGHRMPRRTKSGTCVACGRADSERYKAKMKRTNPELLKLMNMSRERAHRAALRVLREAVQEGGASAR